MAQLPSETLNVIRLFSKSFRLKRHNLIRQISFTSRLASNPTELNKEEVKSDLVSSNHAKEILKKEFPGHYRNDDFIARMSYVEFIDEALARAKDLKLNKDIEFYKELLKIFPAKKYWPIDSWQFGLFYAPQQLAASRVLEQMAKNGVRPDKDFEKIIISAFSKRSDVWLNIARFNYWSMKFKNIDNYPLPEKLPESPHQLAKLAMIRMTIDEKSIITVTNSSNVPDSVDKTWIVSAQSPTQQAILERLNEKSTLYIEDGGLTYVGDQYLSYFVLRYYVDDATLKSKLEPKPDFNYNTMKMGFYGKPIKEKLASLEDQHYCDGYYTLAVGITGTSSQDSLLSWLKTLQQRSPNLKKLNVVFKMTRPSPEIVSYEEHDDDGQNGYSHDKGYRKEATN